MTAPDRQPGASWRGDQADGPNGGGPLLRSDRPHDTEDRYRRLLNRMSALVFELAPDGTTLFVNEAVTTATGLLPDQLLGKNWWQTLVSNPSEVLPLLALLQIEDVTNYPLHISPPGRPPVTLELNTANRYDRTGRLESVLGFAIDVTERQQALERLRLTQFTVDHAGEAIFWVKADGRYAYANDAGCSHLGYTLGELQQLTVFDINVDLTPAMWEALLQDLRDKHTVTVHRMHRAKDGRLIPVEGTSSYMVFGGQTYVCGFVRDISERKQLEERFLQAQKMEAVGRLAGGVAHDFNNMLTVIISYCQLMLPGLSPADPNYARLTEIHKAAQHAASVSDQLLAFSRKQVMHPRPLDLNAVVQDMDRLLRRMIGEDIDLLTIPGMGLGQVQADPTQIQQVLVNLVINARDAMPRGGKLTIETANVELDAAYAGHRPDILPGRYVMLAVSDNGSGMDDKTVAQVFEPFFTTKEQGKGTGLGLATVYGIVKQSGGHIWVYSEPGMGTSFKIYLPRVDVAGSGHQEDEAGATSGGHETVLLVEDEPGIRAVAREILELNGYTVLSAASSEAALALCARHDGPIHLLLTDVVMPQMSGPALVEKLAALRPEIKILFMSGYTGDAIDHYGLAERAAHLLRKPFTPDTLARKVREALEDYSPA